jgi:integrase
MHYFGPWEGPMGALQKYQGQRDDLHAGRTPRVQSDGLTVADLCNRFISSKRHLLDTRELTPRTFQDNYQTCAVLVGAFGRTRLVADLATDDFERLRVTLAKRWGPVRLGNVMQRIRSVFKFAHDAGLIEKPIRFGPGFKRPSKKTLRLERAKNGPRMFEADELRKLLAAAKQPLKAMILLGINCGFGNTDVSTLPLEALDLGGGWVNFPRPKTGINRRCPLWPETIEAIRDVLASRMPAKNEADARLVFLTRCGFPWIKVRVEENPVANGDRPKLKVWRDDAVTKEIRKLVIRLGIHRKGLNFYSLRHSLETIGGESRDQIALDHIMGHVRDDMASVYRERISDERLRAVVDHVRDWLFADESTPAMKLAAVDNDLPQAEAAV